MQSAEVRRLLDQHGVTRVQEHLAHQVQRLLRPIGDEDVINRAAHREPRQALADQRPQRSIPLARSVLERLRAIRFEHPLERATVFVNREQLGRWQATRQRDDVRLRGDLQDLANV